MSANGEEMMVNAREYTRESLGDGEEEEKEEKERTRDGERKNHG